MKENQSSTVAVRKGQQDAALPVKGTKIGNNNKPTGHKDIRAPIKPMDKKNANSVPPPPSKTVNSINDPAEDQASEVVSSNTAMSRTKKEIITAVVGGQQLVQIERLNNFCQSHGVAESYMWCVEVLFLPLFVFITIICSK